MKARLRDGLGHTARGTVSHSCGSPWDACATSGPTDDSRIRADGGFSTQGMGHPNAATMDVRCSFPLRSTAWAISSRRYPWCLMDGDCLLDGRCRRCGRVHLQGFQAEADASSVRLIVRRVNRRLGSQLALFSQMAITPQSVCRDGEMLELEAEHRRHFRDPNSIRDFIERRLADPMLPSGRFASNGSWLKPSRRWHHKLARWTTRIGLGERIAPPRPSEEEVVVPSCSAHPLGTPVDAASSGSAGNQLVKTSAVALARLRANRLPA